MNEEQKRKLAMIMCALAGSNQDMETNALNLKQLNGLNERIGLKAKDSNCEGSRALFDMIEALFIKIESLELEVKFLTEQSHSHKTDVDFVVDFGVDFGVDNDSKN